MYLAKYIHSIFVYLHMGLEHLSQCMSYMASIVKLNIYL